jgi:hypothetical protein
MTTTTTTTTLLDPSDTVILHVNDTAHSPPL